MTTDPSIARASRWGAIPLDIHLEETPEALADKLPHFEKYGGEAFGLRSNAHFDLVVGTDSWIPVGLVSKTYRLVQHTELLKSAMEFVGRIPKASVKKVEADLTKDGQRIMLRMDLGENFRTGPDGSDVGLQLICRNSVDGSEAIRAHLGWFRFVCANGMMVGVTLGHTRVVHKPDADLSEVFSPLEEQLGIARNEMKTMQKWVRKPVSQDHIRHWVDTKVAAKWNSLAACRIWHICSSGKDARFVPPFVKTLPSHRSVELLHPVPGAPARAENLYSVAQALSWVASRRSDLDEAEASQRDIGKLLRLL